MNLNAVLHHIAPLDLDYLTGPAPAVEDYYRHYGINLAESMPGVRQHIGTFESGHFHLVCQLFLKQDARATVFLVHGYLDHVGLYGHLLRHLLSRGYSVVAFDLPGHGLSTGEPANISSFSHYDRALEDCMRLCAGKLTEPWYVVGQSTGGAAVMSLVLRKPQHPFKRIVLLAPLVQPASWGGWRWVHLAARPLLKKLKRGFPANSHDEAFLDFVQNNDPLQCRHLKVGWITAMRKWRKWFLGLPPSKDKPLILQGDGDGTVDWRYNLEQLESKFPDAEVVVLSEVRHHMVNESAEYRNRIFGAMDRYLGQPPQP